MASASCPAVVTRSPNRGRPRRAISAVTKLKLGPISDDKPVKLTVELPADLHRDLIAYGEILGREAGQGPVDAKKLVVAMLERFIATDRGFAKARRGGGQGRNRPKEQPL